MCFHYFRLVSLTLKISWYHFFPLKTSRNRETRHSLCHIFGNRNRSSETGGAEKKSATVNQCSSQLEVQKLTVDGGAVGLVRRSPSNVGLHTRVRSQLAILCWLTAIKNVDYAKSPLTTSSYLSCADNLCDQAPRYRNQHWFLKSFFKMGTSRPLFHLF